MLTCISRHFSVAASAIFLPISSFISSLIVPLALACSVCLSPLNAADQLFEFREGRYRQSVWIPENVQPLRGIVLDCAQWRYNYDPTILREAAREWGFAYATTTTRQGKGPQRNHPVVEKRH